MKPVKLVETPSSILVVITRRIGDVLLTTPMIRSLRLAWPDARIDALVFAGTEGVLAANPDLDQVITVGQRPTLHQHLRLLLRLRRSYDLALSMMSGDRPTIYAFIAGKHSVGLVAPGVKHLWKKWLLSQSAQFDNLNTHTVLMNLKLADLLDVPRCHEVVAAWNPSDENTVAGALPFDIGAETFAVLHMSPKFTYKMWQRDGWIELGKWLAENGIRPVLTGSSDPAELAYVEQIYRSMPSSTVCMVGKLSLAESAFLISRAKYYVGPDTALTHMAAALGTPTVALFGPSNPVKWGPWPKDYGEDRNPYRMRGTQRVNNVVLLQGEGECVPCMEEGCERHNASLSDCLQNLPAASVIAAIRDLSKVTGHRAFSNSAQEHIASRTPAL